MALEPSKDGKKYFIFVDGKSGETLPIPPKLDTVRPDLFARESVSKEAVIGEAKTAGDVDNPHTELQLITYYRFLADERAGRLVLAVPWKALDEMYYVATRTRKKANAGQIPFTVHGWLLPEADMCITQHG